MKKYALCIGLGVLLNLSFVNNAACQMSFKAWENNLRQLGNSMKQDVLTLGGQFKNTATQIVTKSNQNINQLKNKSQNTFRAKSSSFFANLANKLSTPTNQ